MKITGELLKSERTRRDLSIQDVAFALKLSSKIITSIEAGQSENLPAKTFIRGFVKSYAQFLKMDVDQVMRQFQEEMGTTHPLPKNPPPLPASETTKSGAGSSEKRSATEKPTVLRESKNSKTFVYIGIAVLLVILIVATNRIVDRYQKETVVDTDSIAQVQPLETPPAAATVPSSDTSAASASQDSSGALASAASTDLTPSAVSTPTSTPVATVAEVPTSTPAVAPVASLYEGFEPSIGKPIEVIIEAKKEIEILYSTDNKKAFSKLKLMPKQLQVIRSPTGLYLKSDDGSSFNLVVNGIDKGVAGSHNKPVKLSF